MIITPSPTLITLFIHGQLIIFIQILFEHLLRMGPSQNKQQQQPESEALVINHNNFSNVKVVSLPTEDDEGAIEIVVPLPNQSEFKKWQGQVLGLKEGENIFLPVGQKFQKTEFCGSGGLATITYKYYPYLLRDEVVNRRNMEGKLFEESELWYLIYSIISAANSFHARGIKVGDIRPQNVFISPEGQVRVATQFSWPGEQTNYLKTIFEKYPTYLSPEELKDINYGKLQESSNFALNQAFSIGLTCLDAATLFDCSELYEANNKFNYSKLQEKLGQLQRDENYTSPLILLIKGLCQVEGDKRISCRELIEWLARYQTPIIELQDFTINELPDKLHRLTQPKPLKSQPVSNIPTNYISAPNSQPLVWANNPTKFLPPQSTSTFTTVGNPVRAPPTFDMPLGSQGNNFTYKGQGVGRGNINFSQIDEQLQMSRKLFPS